MSLSLPFHLPLLSIDLQLVEDLEHEPVQRNNWCLQLPSKQYWLRVDLVWYCAELLDPFYLFSLTLMVFYFRLRCAFGTVMLLVVLCLVFPLAHALRIPVCHYSHDNAAVFTEYAVFLSPTPVCRELDGVVKAASIPSTTMTSL